MTSYTFDFLFFEYRVLKALRSVNINNINLFIDAHQLEAAIENTEDISAKRKYSITPVKAQGVFHPKIMLLTGKNEGMLVIGSGNLTSSGLSNNDEIWGAFQYGGVGSPNEALFASAWHYLGRFFDQVNGFNRQRIEWIKKYSPWVNDLKIFTQPDWSVMDEKRNIRFINNKAGSNVMQQLQEALPSKEILSIAIVSPYFDDHGYVIQELQHTYNPKEIIIITDVEYGVLPVEFPVGQFENVRFYNWKDCLPEDKKTSHRLHAKIFQFVFEDEEYVMLGSANATKAAFGYKSQEAINEEAGIIIQSTKKGNTLKELGVDWQNATTILLPGEKNKAVKGDENIPVSRKHQIKHAQVDTGQLSVHLQIETDVTCIMECHFATMVEPLEVSFKTGKWQGELKNASELIKICLQDNGERISNFCLVDQVRELNEGNPDQSLDKLRELISAIESNPHTDEYIKLLEHLNYNWVDEEVEEQKRSGDGVRLVRRTPEEEKVYGEMTREEFDALSTSSSGIAFLSNASVHIAEVLQQLSSGLLKKEEDFKEDQEQMELKNKEKDGGGDDQVPQKNTYQVNGEFMRKAIDKYFDRVKVFYSKKVKDFLESSNSQKLPKDKVSIRELSHVEIAVELLFLNHGKHYEKEFTAVELYYDDKYGELYESVKEKFKVLDSVRKTEGVKVVTYEVPTAQLKAFTQEINDTLTSNVFVGEEFQSFSKVYTIIEDGVFRYNQSNQVLNTSGLKKELLQVFGMFLLCANPKAGFEDYQGYDNVRRKMESFQVDVFHKLVFLACSLQWGNKGKALIELLLLNALHSMLPKNTPIDLIERGVIDCLTKKERLSDKDDLDELEQVKDNLQANFDWFKRDVYNPYVIWKSTLENDKNSLLTPVDRLPIDSIVYRSDFGFARFKEKATEGIYVNLIGLFPTERKDMASYTTYFFEKINRFK